MQQPLATWQCSCRQAWYGPATPTPNFDRHRKAPATFSTMTRLTLLF